MTFAEDIQMKTHGLLPLACAIACVALATLSAGPAGAANQIEASFETSTRLVPVPVTQHDTLLLANCKSCDKVSAQVTPKTEFYIGDEKVSLSELREYTATRPALLSCVYYSTPGRKVNRFVVARLEPVDGTESDSARTRKSPATKKSRE